MASIVSDVASVAQWTKYYNLWPCKGSTATHVTRIKDFSWKQTVACCGIFNTSIVSDGPTSTHIDVNGLAKGPTTYPTTSHRLLPAEILNPSDVGGSTSLTGPQIIIFCPLCYRRHIRNDCSHEINSATLCLTSHIVTDHAFHTDVAPDNVLATSCMTVTQEVTDHHSLSQTAHARGILNAGVLTGLTH